MTSLPFGELPQAAMPTRYALLLDAALRLIPCDAAALLKLDGTHLLRPVAVHGLSEEALQRRFPLAGHPRLSTLMRSRGMHRFPADCGLPDPYDGLVEHPSAAADPLLPVHDCMGAPLWVEGRPWGVVTFDALEPGAFDAVDEEHLRAALEVLQQHLPAVEAHEHAAGESAQQAFPPAATIVRPVRQLEGRSPAWLQLMREVDTVAASDLTVLILGETGVGKELVAQRLHEGSRRAQRPLVQVNCAALPETLADSELFGHRRGAFTGATQDRTGKFELAAGGSLMLDEVGELPLSIQAKLLRVLQSGDIQRPGSDRPLTVDVRVVAATNRDLRAEVAAGRFRADLYHRLAVYPVHVPPLRARGRDVLALAGSFLEENQHRLGARNLRLSPAAREALLRYEWPGNVRELEHLISRAALRAWAEQRKSQRWTAIEPEHLGLPRAVTRQAAPGAATGPASGPTAGSVMRPAGGSVMRPAEGSVMRPAEGSVMRPAAGSTRGAAADSVTRVAEGSARGFTEGSAGGLADSSASGLADDSASGLADGSASGLVAAPATGVTMARDASTASMQLAAPWGGAAIDHVEHHLSAVAPHRGAIDVHPMYFDNGPAQPPYPSETPHETLRAATDAFQRQWLHALLQRHPGSLAAAAREAGMDRSNFHRLLKKLGVTATRR